MSKPRLAFAVVCAFAALSTGTASATGGEKVLNSQKSVEYVCISVTHSGLLVEKVGVCQHGHGPSWYGHVGFTSNVEPHVVGPDDNPVPWVIIQFDRRVRKGTDFCDEAWVKESGGYERRGQLCMHL
ncbi:hypothetical protein [Saccharothrix sp. NRRL B-16314]|uniref:hypothetical protein n=1 Tax=Saccharothrix sp. NRRL B-16314 TaxID=1463825 RepID=UPI0005253E53|nr:hypothetical protein [Saccharothrix sp. NRRL B-16314]